MSDRQIEPFGAVDFRKDLHLSASRGPFDFEGVAFDSRNVEAAFDREAKDAFAGTLTDLGEWLKWARESNTRLLRELPDGGDTGCLAWIHFAFRDRPRALVLAAPVGSARMHQKDFQFRSDAPMYQDPRA